MPHRPATRLALALAAILFLAACGRQAVPASPAGPGAAELSGHGYVHYHYYPDTGTCYCGTGYPFTEMGKMIAAASPSIHAYYGEFTMCSRPRYAILTSQATGRSIRVRIVDKGGQPTGDFQREEQHIMDISEEAFDALDFGGEGKFAGRIYVDWRIEAED